ncbi:MAG TPA: Gfo/Idh/MocA family oxidoreductase [Thermomicrobiales bacterium]|jgi:predicted dehydrogenase|nr:Gfo/Idh/MocA family oxidoreductase [Thermomicrobiales bacterium]
MTVPHPETVRRITLIGAGMIAREHAAAIGHLPNAGEIALAVADPSPTAREGFLERFPGIRVVADAAELLAEPAQPGDVVIVATPPFTHRALTLQALASGRHVLCEKPLAMDVDEAEEMVAAAERAGRVLAECSNRFLGLPANVAVRDLITAGELGPLTSATFVHRVRRARTGIEYLPDTSWFLNSSRSGGGVLMDWGCYDLSTLIHVLRPVSVDVMSAFSANPETALDLPPGTVFDTDQHVGAALVFHRADGQRVPVAYERAAAIHGTERQVVEIEGTRSAVRWDWLDWQGDGRVTVMTDRDGQPHEDTRTLGVPAVFCHQRPLVAFAAMLRGEPSETLAGNDALFGLRVLRAVQDAATSGRPQSIARTEMAR